MRHRILFVLLTGCLASASLSHVAAAQSCVPPPPNPHVTPAQQQLAAEGFRLACASSNAPGARQLPRPPEADIGVGQDDFRPVSLAGYKKWLSRTCPRLNQQAAAKLNGRSDEDQLVVLQSIYDTIKERNSCN